MPTQVDVAPEGREQGEQADAVEPRWAKNVPADGIPEGGHGIQGEAAKARFYPGHSLVIGGIPLTTDAGKDLGAKITVKRFARFEMGEGLQKRECNFAEEIAAATRK